MEKLSKKTMPKLHITNLDNPTWEKLCSLLDEDLVIGNNYKQLAGHVGLTRSDLVKIAKASQPTDSVLKWWGHKLRATIPELMRILTEMGREDCVEILAEAPICATSGVSGTGHEYARICKEHRGVSGTIQECSRISEELKGHKKELEVGDLPPSVYDKLCDKLNEKMEGKDYVALADKMNYTNDQLKTFKKRSPDNPANEILQDWRTKDGHDVRKLSWILRVIKRDDLAKMLEGQDYKDDADKEWDAEQPSKPKKKKLEEN